MKQMSSVILLKYRQASRGYLKSKLVSKLNYLGILNDFVALLETGGIEQKLWGCFFSHVGVPASEPLKD